MKVLIATGLSFGKDAERNLADELATRLRARGHRVDLLRLPLWGTGTERLLMDMLVARSIELSNTDHLISMSFPANLVRHTSKALWLLEPPPTVDPPARELERAVALANAESFTESRVAFAASPALRDHFARFGHLLELLAPDPLQRGSWSNVLDRLLP